MKLNNQERKTLKRIKIYYEKIGDLMGNIDNSKQEEILCTHNEHGTLQHCNRWGLQAVTEILQFSKGEKNG